MPGINRSMNQRLAVATFLAAVFSLGLASGLGHLYHEARPFVSDSSTRLLIHHSTDNSFPSEHAVFVFSVGGVVVWWRRTLGMLILSTALVVGIARIYVGVHWPLDILSSAIVGLATGAGLSRLVPVLTTPQRMLARYLPSFLLANP
jgi:undecaprenyl-diphosphatase